MKSSMIASINDLVNENVVDGGLEIYSLGWALEPGRSSRGTVYLFPLPNSSPHVCMYIQRKGVFRPTFGADGLKTFVQGLLLTHLREHKNKLSHMQYLPHKREGGGGEQCGRSGLLGLDYFASFIKL